MAHAKDRYADGRFATAGQGVVDFGDFIARLRGIGFDGPLVTHGLSAAEAPAVAAFLKGTALMPAAALRRDDASLQVFDRGNGPAVVFQHGLGGDEAQVAQVFPDDAGWRRLTVECRGHGGSTLGSTRPFGFAMFADDVLAAADDAGLDRFAVGGISMGAAIALRLAVRHPDRVAGLVLVRPAWAFAAGAGQPAPGRRGRRADPRPPAAGGAAPLRRVANRRPPRRARPRTT